MRAFGPNGVVLSELDDMTLYNESKSKTGETIIITLLGLCGCLTVSLAVNARVVPDGLQRVLQICLLAVGGLFIFSGSLFFALKERANQRFALFIKPLAEPRHQHAMILPHRHVTGFGAAIFIALFLFLAGAAIFGQVQHPNFQIPEIAGLIVIASLCFAFACLMFAPILTDVSQLNKGLNALRRYTGFLGPLGQVISWLDSVLVYVIAPLVGSSLKNWQSRYAAISLHLFVSACFAWFSPAPYGLFSCAWVLLISISIARRWAWIEAERERQFQKRDKMNGPGLIETSQDLRDEALFALLFMVFILPLSMRQIHLWTEGGVFELSMPVEHNFFAWMGFFGVELVKALPFIDWSDIYGAHGNTTIRIVSPLAMHLVFAARVLIDLVFLASLLQAITISVSLAKHKKRFLAKVDGLTRLDPRIEKIELSKLAFWSRRGGWQYKDEIDNYVHYDTARLSLLRLKSKRGTRLHEAVCEIFRRTNAEFESPASLLRKEALNRHLDVKRLRQLLDDLEAVGAYDLDSLTDARSALNWKGNISDIRAQIIGIIISKKITPSHKKVLALGEMIAGDEVDSLSIVRARVLDYLGRNRNMARQAAAKIKIVAMHDKKAALRLRAQDILRRYKITADGDQPDLEKKAA